jgi:molybdopterin biosynthesis enzyme
MLTLRASSERRNLARALDQAMGCCDVLLVVGGSGPTAAVLDGMGFSFLFRMVAQEPAGSLACAMNKEGTVMFLLPNRILPALVSAEEYVIPSLRRMAGFKGCRKRVFVGESTFDYAKEPGRQNFIGVLAYREGSDWKLHRPDSGGSGYHTVTGNMNSLAIAGADQLSIRSGDPLNFHFLCSAAGEMSFA